LNLDNLKFNHDGLIPVVTQNYYTGKVLMQAYANKEAIEETLKSGYATYFSRSEMLYGKKVKLLEIIRKSWI
jgi:phosphoribosyl-ATP pyrophosphatase (EC 3.6.1.31)/phosphoribosyl-AMP cyclohydrolase (EC 3.5.4.19)